MYSVPYLISHSPFVTLVKAGRQVAVPPRVVLLLQTRQHTIQSCRDDPFSVVMIRTDWGQQVGFSLVQFGVNCGTQVSE